MTALEALFLEVEKHAVLRAHAKLVQAAREEYKDLKKKLATAVYMAANGETPHTEPWDETIASLELACRPYKPGD